MQVDKHFSENVLRSTEKLIKFAQMANSVYAVGTVVNHPELPCTVLK